MHKLVYDNTGEIADAIVGAVLLISSGTIFAVFGFLAVVAFLAATVIYSMAGRPRGNKRRGTRTYKGTG